MSFGDVVQQNSGTSTTATTSPSLGSAVTAGNIVVLTFAADDYNGTVNAGWTQSANNELQQFHGGYLWWMGPVTAGQAIPQYTIASAVRSIWNIVEYEGPFDASPFDKSNGQGSNSSASSYNTSTITPSVGGRLIIASINFQHANNDMGTSGSWTNSFSLVISTVFNGANPRLTTSQARRVVTGDNVTGYNTAATLTSGNAQSRSAPQIVFKQGSTTPVLPIIVMPPRRP